MRCRIPHAARCATLAFVAGFVLPQALWVRPAVAQSPDSTGQAAYANPLPNAWEPGPSYDAQPQQAYAPQQAYDSRQHYDAPHYDVQQAGGVHVPQTTPQEIQPAGIALPLPGATAAKHDKATDSQPMPLRMGPRSSAAATTHATGSLGSILTTLGALGLVLALFLGATWMFRRSTPAGTTLLDRDVAEVLGRMAIAPRQQGYLLRCGNKLVLVALSPNGIQPITEITDPVEVDRLAGLCRSRQSQSTSESFRQVLASLGSPSGTRRGLFSRSTQQPTIGELDDAGDEGESHSTEALV